MNRFVSTLFLYTVACGTSTVPESTHEGHAQEQEENHREVTLAPAAVSAARIASEPAKEGELTAELSLPARVSLDPRKEAVVSAWIAGQVDAITVRNGDTVRPGQTLGTVQSTELGEAIAAYRGATARDKAADARLERLQRLEADGVASRSQVLESIADHAEAEAALEASEERLRILGVDPSKGNPHTGEHYASHVPVKSPIAGKVLTTGAVVGRQVAPGDTLFHIGDLSEVWLLINVYERDLSRVTKGQAVRFEFQSMPGEVIEGFVEQVGDWVDPNSRSIEMRVVVENQDGRLKPNMYATATLSVASKDGEHGILLTTTAVQMIDGQEMVFIEKAPGSYEARPVVISERTSTQVLIQSGVNPGERLVHEGAFTLKSELEKSELGEGHAH
jgi:cobalt-zinc-cadmium efflux system membrane fusion protein